MGLIYGVVNCRVDDEDKIIYTNGPFRHTKILKYIEYIRNDYKLYFGRGIRSLAQKAIFEANIHIFSEMRRKANLVTDNNILIEFYFEVRRRMRKSNGANSKSKCFKKKIVNLASSLNYNNFNRSILIDTKKDYCNSKNGIKKLIK